MSLEGIDLSRLQAIAESAMITPCRIVRSTPGAFDPGTNLTTSTASLLWTGSCNIETRAVLVGFSESGESIVASTDYTIQVPVEAIAAGGDLLQALNDAGDVVTRAFYIEGIHRPTWEVQQSLQVVDVPVTAITVT